MPSFGDDDITIRLITDEGHGFILFQSYGDHSDVYYEGPEAQVRDMYEALQAAWQGKAHAPLAGRGYAFLPMRLADDLTLCPTCSGRIVEVASGHGQGMDGEVLMDCPPCQRRYLLSFEGQVGLFRIQDHAPGRSNLIHHEPPMTAP